MAEGESAITVSTTLNKECVLNHNESADLYRGNALAAITKADRTEVPINKSTIVPHEKSCRVYFLRNDDIVNKKKVPLYALECVLNIFD
jgi:hypothetical protein